MMLGLQAYVTLCTGSTLHMLFCCSSVHAVVCDHVAYNSCGWLMITVVAQGFKASLLLSSMGQGFERHFVDAYDGFML
jgi:hypothetical protein